MDAKLRRELDAIARDNRSGAAELTLRAVAALHAALRRHKPGKDVLVEVARGLWAAQPSMAPLLRLANEVLLGVASRDPAGDVIRRVTHFGSSIRHAHQQIARLFSDRLGREKEWDFVTYSYSSTVVAALMRARSRVRTVFCSESRPGSEGRNTARMLSEHGIQVVFVTDAALHVGLENGGVLLLGADAIHEEGFRNKMGTHPLVAWALHVGRPVWVLADKSKFLPLDFRFFMRGGRRHGPPKEVWANNPQKVFVVNPYFELTPLGRGIRVLTEKGWMTPAQVRRELKKIRISPRLNSLVD